MNSKKSQASKPTSFSLQTLATFSLVAVSAGYVFLSIAARLLSEGFLPFTQIYARLSVALVVSILLFRKNIRLRIITSIPKKDWIGLLLMGVIGYGVYVYFVTVGSLHAKLINVAVVLAVGPFFSFLYSFVLFKEKVKSATVILLCTTFLGVGMVASKSYLPHLSSFGTGELYVLAATVCGAWFFVGRRMLSKHLNNSEITVTVMAIAFVTTFVAALCNKEPFSLSALGNWHVTLGLGIGALFNIIATRFESFSLQYITAGLASQILLLENAFAPIFGYILYKEIPVAPEIFGSLLIVGSVYLANRFNPKN